MADKVDRRQRFLASWPEIRDELVAYVKDSGLPVEAQEWYKRNLDYNTPGGKLNRGMSVVDTAEIIKGSALTAEELKKANILGWGIELLQAYFLVADDMMDASVTRRGQPCWYRVKEVGNIAINDAFMLEGAIYFLLKKYFRSDSYYVDLLELFHDVTYQTELGQLIDLLTAPEDDIDLNRFSLQKHSNIVIFKTAYYSFYLPVALGMRMFGVKDESSYKAAEDILLPLGEYFQVQDDYLDCYGAPEVIGKIGTDILDNKCSWNINIALKYATAEQRKVLDENYGRKNKDAEARVKEVFSSKEVDIPKRFAEYEAESYERINKLIDEFKEVEGMKKEVFRSFLAKVYKRKA